MTRTPSSRSWRIWTFSTRLRVSTGLYFPRWKAYADTKRFTVEIGTPGQTVTVLVDTGSSELWVNPDCDTVPTDTQQEQCDAFGSYDPKKSKTPPIGPFGSEEINYGDPTDDATQTSVSLRYYTETLGFGDYNITNQTFGVVESSEGISQGIFGLAPDLNGGFDGDEPYSLVLNTMFEQGLIASRVFSLDLRHSEAKTGAVIYGGVDKSKFIGKLDSHEIIRGARGEFRLAVRLNSMGLTIDDESQDYDLGRKDSNVILDSGTTLTRMHASAAAPILRALDAMDDGEGYYYTDCSLRETGGSVDFGFDSTVIRVPFRDFIIDVGAPDYCAIGMVITTDQQILGDTVLRAGYFVFDWDNEAVHIAQAADCGDEDIEAVSSGRNAVPDVTGNCKESDANFTGGPVPTATSSDSDESFPTSAYTTTYTITSCPGFDRDCQTGVVTTQTISASEATSTSDDGGSDDDDEDAAARAPVVGWMIGLFGGGAVMYNMI